MQSNQEELTLLNRREQELKSCNTIKTILMLSVVIYHSTFIGGSSTFTGLNISYGYSGFLYYLYLFMQPLHTRTFFLISGYIYAYIRFEKGGYQSISKFIGSKALRLLVPYFLIGFLWIIPIKIILKFDDVPSYCLSILLGKGADQLWFVFTLFLIFVIFRIFEKFIVKHKTLSFIISIILYGAGYLIKNTDYSYFYLGNVCMSIYFFLHGYFLRLDGTEKARKIKWYISIPIYISLFTLSMIIDSLGGNVYSVLSDILFASIFMFGAQSLFILLLKLFEKVGTPKGKIWKALENNSMTIYLLHQQIIYILFVLLQGTMDVNLIWMITSISTIIVSLLLSFLFKTNKVTKFIIGEKV